MSLNFNRERGFVNPNGIFRKEISIKIWIELCKHPELTLTLAIWEFYENLCAKWDGTIFAWGKWALFGKKEINEYY